MKTIGREAKKQDVLGTLRAKTRAQQKKLLGQGSTHSLDLSLLLAQH